MEATISCKGNSGSVYDSIFDPRKKQLTPGGYNYCDRVSIDCATQTPLETRDNLDILLVPTGSAEGISDTSQSTPNIPSPKKSGPRGVSSIVVMEGETRCVDMVSREEGMKYSRKKEQQFYVFDQWMNSWEKADGGIAPVGVSSPTFGEAITDVCTASITVASTTENTRKSMDSNRSVLDSDTVGRANERIHVVKELVSTEEYYVQDLKALRDQCIPLLRNKSTISADVIFCLERNISDMIHLHSRLLGDISKMLPSTQQVIRRRTLETHSRAADLDKMPVLAQPHAAGEIATAFDNMIPGFFQYEEYAARYVLVSNSLKKNWNGMSPQLRKGSEVLVGTTRSNDNRQEYGKRAMELDDMIVKPIQRMCKYPLLFREILKNTPAIDCPESNRILEKVLYRLDDVVARVNEANRQAAKKRQTVENTWLLQDRLIFREQQGRPTRLLGHVILCGTLHIIWQTNSHVYGSYMACMLFNSYFLLAKISDAGHYEVQFAIALAVSRIEEADRGKGLHSPSAPYSWKIVFESCHKLYEVLVTGYSEHEEIVWRDHLQRRMFAESIDHDQYARANWDICTVYPDTKPIGDVHGRLGSFARRQSLYGTLTTSLLDPGVTYVIVSNSGMSSSMEPVHVSLPVNSAVRLGLNGVPTFHMRRSNRNSVVFSLRDVWTKDLLPLDGNSGGVHKSRLSKVFKGSKSSLKSIRNKSFADLRTENWDGDDMQRLSSAMHRLSWAPCENLNEHGVRCSPKKKKSHTSLRGLFVAGSGISRNGRQVQSVAAADARKRRSTTLANKFSFGSVMSKEDSANKQVLAEDNRQSDAHSAVEGSATPVSITTDEHDSLFSRATPSTPTSSMHGDQISLHETLIDSSLLREMIQHGTSWGSTRKHNLSFRSSHKRKSSHTSYKSLQKSPSTVMVEAAQSARTYWT